MSFGDIPRVGACVGALAAVLLAGGCSNEDAVLGLRVLNPSTSPQVSLSKDVQPIFTVRCATTGCHGSSFPNLGLILIDGESYANLVNVKSAESPLDRVEPGDSAASYLMHKLQGTQTSVGGSGDQMPRFSTPLPDAEIDLIRSWIDQGAQDN